jgi:hypothetical protein
MKDQSPKEEAEKLQNTMSELCIRVASLEKRLTNPTITYCDDAYYLALDYFKMEAHRADAYGCIEKLKNDLDALKTMLDGVNTKKIKKSIEGFVGQVVDSDSVPHNNHYRLNLIAGAVSCSLQHCYGKSP